MGHTPGFPCVMENPDHLGNCVTPIDPEQADRTRAAMAHHARGDALEFLGAPEPSGEDSEGQYWMVDGIAIGATVENGQAWVDVNFPHQPDDRVVPEYVRQGPADVMERWLLAGLAAVHAARAQASTQPKAGA